MDVSKNRGTPKWMVKIMENTMNKWMIWGEYFWKHPYFNTLLAVHLEKLESQWLFKDSTAILGTCK